MGKKLSVIWELDEASVAALEALALAASGRGRLCSSLHPHITLGTYDDIDESKLAPYVAAFAAKVRAFPVKLEAVGLLSPSCAVCFPAYEGGLKAHYPRFHRRFERYADRWTSLKGGLYTPHISLYSEEPQVSREAQMRLTEAFRPFRGRVQSLALSWVRGEDDYEVRARHPLMPDDAPEK